MRVFFDAFFGAFHINYMFQLDMFHHVQVLILIYEYSKNDSIPLILVVLGNQQPIDDFILNYRDFYSTVTKAVKMSLKRMKHPW